MSRTRISTLGVVVAALLIVAALAAPTMAKPSGGVDVQLLAINDFHGNLEPPSGSSGRIVTGPVPGPSQTAPNVNAGGVEYLATHIKTLEAANPNTLVVSAGDLIGASPLISALFHDEPSIEAMNALGLDLNAVGNHEFDEGIDELVRMQNGGCHPVDGCLDGDEFAGADFRFLAANVTWHKNGKTVFPPYKIYSFGAAKIALVGIVTRTTPTIVSPAGISALDFADEADTMNALIPELHAKGVQTIVALIHEGGFPTGLYNECPGISGAIVDIVHRTEYDVDIWLSGHTHQGYNCIIEGEPITSGSSFGRLVTDVDMTIDRATGATTSLRVDNVIVTRTVAKDSDESAIINRYKSLSAPFANRVVGSITDSLLKAQNAAGESTLGNFIADSQLFATTPADRGAAVAAFMNPGGVRVDLLYPKSGPETEDGVVRYEEIFNVQPFGNSLVTMTLTGAQIETMLEQQFLGDDRILQPANVSYSWSQGAVDGDRVDPAGVVINGAPLDLDGSYRVTVNSFLSDGGDRFPVLVQGTNKLGGDVDLDAVEKYFAAQSGPVSPPPLGRITVAP